MSMTCFTLLAVLSKSHCGGNANWGVSCAVIIRHVVYLLTYISSWKMPSSGRRMGTCSVGWPNWAADFRATRRVFLPGKFFSPNWTGPHFKPSKGDPIVVPSVFAFAWHFFCHVKWRSQFRHANGNVRITHLKKASLREIDTLSNLLAAFQNSALLFVPFLSVWQLAFLWPKLYHPKCSTLHELSLFIQREWSSTQFQSE